MNFGDYIKEAEDLEAITDILEKDCGKYLKELRNTKSGQLLWRGSRHRIKVMEKIQTRMDRKPLGTPEDDHLLLDEIFDDHHGLKARSQGVFVSPSKKTAQHYGSPSIFFPIGKYKYLWSPEVEDLYGTLEDEEDYMPTAAKWDDWEEEWQDEYSREGTGGTWHYLGTDTGDVYKEDALDTAAEAEGVDPDEIDEDELEWVPEVDWEDFIKDKEANWEEIRYNNLSRLVKGYWKNQGLKKNFKNKNEMVFFCKEYYLVAQRYEIPLGLWIYGDR